MGHCSHLGCLQHPGDDEDHARTLVASSPGVGPVRKRPVPGLARGSWAACWPLTLTPGDSQLGGLPAFQAHSVPPSTPHAAPALRLLPTWAEPPRPPAAGALSLWPCDHPLYVFRAPCCSAWWGAHGHHSGGQLPAFSHLPASHVLCSCPALCPMVPCHTPRAPSLCPR